MSTLPTLQQFIDHTASTFCIPLAQDHKLDLRLAEVKKLGERTSRDGAVRQSFALTFTGPSNFYLPQQIYPMEHATLGSISLFIVPVGKDEQGLHYEAIIN